MHSWERFDEISLPAKNAFYSELYLEDIADVDYRHAKKIFRNFNIKNLGDYRDLYVQSDTLLLADVFENFGNMCYNIYELDPGYFLSAPGLTWQACLKKAGVRLELLIDNDMLLMVEKGIRGGIYHATNLQSVNGCKWKKNIHKFDEEFIKSFDEDSDKGYIFDVDVEYPKNTILVKNVKY